MSTRTIALSTTAVAFAVFCWHNHRRIRRSKSCMRAVRLHPPPGVPRRPHPLVFLSETAQKADVWRGRMEILVAAGFECHALDFTQTGRYLLTYHEQLSRLRDYIVHRLDGRPVLIGHSQGGSKAQLYMLAAVGDAKTPDESRARAMVLMATSEASLLQSTPSLVASMLRFAGLRAVLAGALGNLYLDPLAFCYGGGPWRHELQMYRGLFLPQTTETTLRSAHAHLDARVDGAPARELDCFSLATWADTYLANHEPFVADLGIVEHARSASDALGAHGCSVLHLAAEMDQMIPCSMSERIGAMWGAPTVVVEGQAHQMGDAGWEESVMRPLRAFLEGL